MNDVALGPQLLNGLDKHIETLEIRRIDKCSHWVMSDQPELVSTAIHEFVSPKRKKTT